MKICLLRLSALGDVAQALLLVRCLQQHFPEAQISWVIGRNEARLLGDLPGIHLVIFDKKLGWGAYRELRRQLKNQRFDVLLNMHMSLRASLASLLIKAPRRIGYDRQRAHEGNFLVSNQHIEFQAQQSVLESFLAFGKSLGVDCQIPEKGWGFPVSAEARALGLRLLPEGQQYFVVSPLSSHRIRSWRAERYAAVMDHMQQQHGLRAVLIGGPGADDRAFAEAVMAAMQGDCINLTGADSLATMAGVIARASLLLAPDSGPLHIANALGVPLVGLYACTDVQRSGPVGQRRYCANQFAAAAQRFLGKSPEQLKWRTKIEFEGVMDLITVEQVIDLLQLRWSHAQA